MHCTYKENADTRLESDIDLCKNLGVLKNSFVLGNYGFDKSFKFGYG